MIGYKSRVGRRVKSKMARNIETLYKEGRCRDCSVVVTRMDFAKILGKFTKVKIQYESNSSPKSEKQNHNVRLKSNENGMVLLNRNTKKSHSAKDHKIAKESKSIECRSKSNLKKEPIMSDSPKPKPLNVLKERNSCKKPFESKKVISNIRSINSDQKQYAIIFVNPLVNGNNDIKTKVTLADLIPHINKNILPNEDWCIEFFPKNLEPKDDKMYNRIAAELEDLMYNKMNTTTSTENKVDEFPSIMDILNDNSSETHQPKDEITEEFKPSIESSDVEAMLLGKSDTDKPKPMEIDKPDVNKLIEDVVQLAPSTVSEKIIANNEIENPHSPSILDEALKQGVEQHLPIPQPSKESMINSNDSPKSSFADVKEEKIKDDTIKSEPSHTVKYEEITQVIFKKILDGKCDKLVTCLKNLRYNIQLEEKAVEFLGAPKYISSIEDIQVLLQIVNDTTLDSLYVLH